MHVTREAIALTTDGSGDCTAYSGPVTGRVVQLRYVKSTFDNGVGFTVTSEATGETIWAEAAVNSSATRAPRQATHSTAGVASLYAGGGAAVNDHIHLANDRVKIVVASGGAAKTGVVHLVMG